MFSDSSFNECKFCVPKNCSANLSRQRAPQSSYSTSTLHYIEAGHMFRFYLRNIRFYEIMSRTKFM